MKKKSTTFADIMAQLTPVKSAKLSVQEILQQLGCEAEDRVTGFTGMITNVSFNVAGQIYYTLTSGEKPGQPSVEHTFYIKRIKVLTALCLKMSIPQFM
jgi:hypothetical protein